MQTADSQTSINTPSGHLADVNLDALAGKIADKLADKPTHNVERYLTMREVSEIVGITRQQINKMTRKGIFRAYGRGTRMTRYKLSEIEAAMAAL